MKKILVVDDDEMMLELIKLHLEEEGYDVHYCNAPSDAMRLVSDEVYDLIFLDIIMPDINGLDVLKFIKQQEKNKLTPVVMLTSRDDMNSVRDCLTNGAYDYITKPFDIVLVKQCLADVFSQA